MSSPGSEPGSPPEAQEATCPSRLPTYDAAATDGAGIAPGGSVNVSPCQCKTGTSSRCRNGDAAAELVTVSAWKPTSLAGPPSATVSLVGAANPFAVAVGVTPGLAPATMGPTGFAPATGAGFAPATMGAGVAAGASSPYQVEVSNLGTPASAMVGSAGNSCDPMQGIALVFNAPVDKAQIKQALQQRA